MKTRILALLLAGTLGACASIPSAAPELSIELGKRIQAIELANRSLLHSYFALKRDAVDHFIDAVWTPLLAAELMADPNMVALWDSVNASTEASDKQQFLVRLSTKMQAQISQRRQSMREPLEALERSLEQSLAAEYEHAVAINNSLTSLMLSAAEVENNRNRYLGMLGVSETQIDGVVKQVDDAIDSLAKGADQVDKATQTADALQKRLKDIEDKLHNGSPKHP